IERKLLLYPTEFADPQRARDHAPQGEVNLAVHHQIATSWRRLHTSPEFAAALASLTRPVLLIHGVADPRPLACIRELAARLPDARVRTIDDAGHYLWLEQPQALQQLLCDALADLAEVDADAGAGADPGADEATPALAGASRAAALTHKYDRAEAAPWELGRAQRAIAGLVADGRPQGRILDVGCGTGENALLMAAAEPGREVIG